MGMNPERVFDWYPIERLDGLVQKDEAYELRGLSATTSLRRELNWCAVVRRKLGVWPDTGNIIWSSPETVELGSVQHELLRQHDGEYMFKFWRDEQDPHERIRREINEAAEAVAARTEEWAGYARR